MPVDTANITGTFNKPNAEWPEYTTVKFRLSGYDTDTEVVTPIDVETTLDALGNIDVDLWVNQDGIRGTVYSVLLTVWRDDSYARELKRIDFGRIQLDGAGPFNIADLLDVPVSVPGNWYSTLTEAEYDAAIDAASAAEAAAANVALGSPYGFETVQDLRDDTAMGYDPGDDVPVSAGQYILAGGYRYLIVDELATDYHIATGGGVKLTVVPKNGIIHFDSLLPNKDGATDDSALLMTAIGAVSDSFRGRVEISPGQYAMNTETILIPSSVELVGVSSNGGQRGGAASVNRPVNFIANHAGPIIQIGDAGGASNTVNASVSGIAMEAGAGFDQAYIGYLIEDLRNGYMGNLLVLRADKAFHFTAAREAVQYLITERLSSYECNYGLYIDIPSPLGVSYPFMQACRIGVGNMSASLISAVYIGDGQMSHNRLVFEGGQSGGNAQYSIHMDGDSDNRSIWTLEGNAWFENNGVGNVLVDGGATLYTLGDVTDSGAGSQLGGYKTAGNGIIRPIGRHVFDDYVLPINGFSRRGLQYAFSLDQHSDGNFYDSIGGAEARIVGGGSVVSENTRYGSGVLGDGSGGGLRIYDTAFDWTGDWTLAVLLYAPSVSDCEVTRVETSGSTDRLSIVLRNGYAQISTKTGGGGVVIGSASGNNVNPLVGPTWCVLSYEAGAGAGGLGQFRLRNPNGTDATVSYDHDVPAALVPAGYVNWSVNGSLVTVSNTVDEYALYDRVLDAEEVRGLFESTLPLNALVGAPTDMARSTGSTGGASSAGAGNQYVELNIGGTVYKVLHDGTV